VDYLITLTFTVLKQRYFKSSYILWLTAIFNSGVMILGLIEVTIGQLDHSAYIITTVQHDQRRLITGGRYKGVIVHSEGERSGCHSLT